MKAVILAGGLGTRISEESDFRPKPMIELGGRPLIWHIMKRYSDFGINDFIIAVGYKGHYVKEYFANFRNYSDFTVDTRSGAITIIGPEPSEWRVTVIDTGQETMTGGRLKRVEKFIDGTFFMTYGDGLSDINISNLLHFHKKHGLSATLTAVRPPSRFAVIEYLKSGQVTSFLEKPEDEIGWINGGFFVLEPTIFDLIPNDKTVWELEPLQKLVAAKSLMAFRHDGFWHAIDTLRDKRFAESLIQNGEAPWLASEKNIE